MIVCWSTKGGSGTSLVATVLALAAARHEADVVLTGLDHDVAAILGATVDGDRPGLRQWLASPPSVPVDAVPRLLVDVVPRLRLLAPGPTATEALDLSAQVQRLQQATAPSTLVVDAGRCGISPAADSLVAGASTSLLVLRSCFLSVKRATKSDVKADAFVLIEEAGRSLEASDIEEVLGIPCAARCGWDASVARAVDSGRVKSRLPRSLRPLQQLAGQLVDAGQAARAS